MKSLNVDVESHLEHKSIHKIYIIAGESSGDFIGEKVIDAIKSLKDNIKFIGIGGPKIIKAGSLSSLFPISQINLMGFFEILPHIFKLNKLIKNTVNDIISNDPDILVTIDSPGFTYRVAKEVRRIKPSLKILHIVAPSVWAYKPGRAKKFAKVYDHLLALLPFEPPYFTKLGLNCTYIGHPILEQPFIQDKHQDLNQKIIAVTPGSRKAEILRHMPIFIQSLNILVKDIKNIKVIFVLSDLSFMPLLKNLLVRANFSFDFSINRLKIFGIADVALAKSGTNTLEIAASKTPLVVAYKMHPISFLILRCMIKVKYASLINIIADKEISPEFIQNKCTPKNIANSLKELLRNQEIAFAQVQESTKILDKLGFNNTSQKPSYLAAKVILQNL